MYVTYDLETKMDIYMFTGEFVKFVATPLSHRQFPENFAKTLVGIVPWSKREERQTYANPGKQEKLKNKGSRNGKKSRK